MPTPFPVDSRATRMILFRFLLGCVDKERENFGKNWLTLESCEMIPMHQWGF